MYAVFNEPKEIIWSKLPQSFILKWNFGAGANIICKDKFQMDEQVVKQQLKKWEHDKYWLSCSEMHYKYIEPKLICERLLNVKFDSDGCAVNMENYKIPEDYKIFCFNGKAKFIMVCLERFESDYLIFLFFDKEWNEYPFGKKMLGKEHKKIDKSSAINEMFELAECLAKPFPFVRVDLFMEQKKVIFGELTFTPSAGLDNDLPENADKLLGELLQI